MAILNDIKIKVEVDIDEDIYDDQLLLTVNEGVAYLINNKIPIDFIEKETVNEMWIEKGLKNGDYYVVLNWLTFFVLQQFDRSLMTSSNSTTTNNFVDAHMTDLLYHLKVGYDR